MSEEQEHPFIMYEKNYLKIREVTFKKDGKDVVQAFTGNMKVLYRYMFDRYMFFSGTGKEFYDNQAQLADAIGVSERTVVKLVADLCSTGLVEKSHKKIKGAWHSNAYIVHDIFDKTKFDCGEKVSEKCIQKENLKPAPKKHIPEPPVGHPTTLEIPDDVEFEQMAVKKPVNNTIGYDDPEAPF